MLLILDRPCSLPPLLIVVQDLDHPIAVDPRPLLVAQNALFPPILRADLASDKTPRFNCEPQIALNTETRLVCRQEGVLLPEGAGASLGHRNVLGGPLPRRALHTRQFQRVRFCRPMRHRNFLLLLLLFLLLLHLRFIIPAK